MLNIYLLTQNTNRGYDTFDSCMVAAPDEATARGFTREVTAFGTGTDGHGPMVTRTMQVTAGGLTPTM